MAIVPLEQRFEEGTREIEKDVGEGVIYKGNKIFAACKFARNVLKGNQEIINKGIGYYLCYLTTVSSFVYSLIELKYSQEKEGYVFRDKVEEFEIVNSKII